PDPSRSPPSRDSMPFRHSGAPAPPGPPCGTADRGALPADTRSPAEPPPPSCSAPLLPPARIQPPARTPSDSSLSAPFRPPLVRTENLEGDISIRHSRGHYRPSTTFGGEGVLGSVRVSSSCAAGGRRAGRKIRGAAAVNGCPSALRACCRCPWSGAPEATFRRIG